MDQAILDQQVADITGETIDVIRRRGFTLDRVESSDPFIPIDWDLADRLRNTSLLPDRQQRAA
jgi:hypothetical protein